MIEVERHIVIERTPRQVFDHLSRPETYPAWLPGVRSVDVDADGPVGPGAPATLVFAGPSGPITTKGRILEVVPDRRLALEAAAAPLRFAATIELAPTGAQGRADGATELTLMVRLELLGGMAILEGLARAQAIGEVGKALERLKTTVETESSPAGEADAAGESRSS